MGQVGAPLSSEIYPVFWQCFWKRPWFHRATLLHSFAFLSSRAVSSQVQAPGGRGVPLARSLVPRQVGGLPGAPRVPAPAGLKRNLKGG